MGQAGKAGAAAAARGAGGCVGGGGGGDGGACGASVLGYALEAEQPLVRPLPSLYSCMPQRWRQQGGAAAHIDIVSCAAPAPRASACFPAACRLREAQT